MAVHISWTNLFPHKLPNQILPDSELIELLKDKSEQAISLIFKEHYEFLCRSIIRIVNDPHVAEDLAQDVFHDLWKRRENLEISTSIRAYLRRAGINKTLNYIRDKKVKWDDEDKLPMMRSNTPLAIETLESKDLEKLIGNTIEALPDRCRLIFTLSRFEEMSYKEIADSLDLSVKTIENQMSKALKILRDALDPVTKGK